MSASARRRPRSPGSSPRSLAAKKTEPGRVAATSERVRARGEAVADRLQAARPTVRGLDAAFETYERERGFAGSLLGGGLAYRMFLWLLPFALVLTELFGFWSDADPDGVEDAAKEFGLSGAAAQVIGASAATSENSKILLLLLGVVLLLYFTYTLLRAFRLVSATAWGIPYTRTRRLAPSVLALLGVVLALWLASALASAARQASFGVGLVGTLAVSFAYAGAALVGFWLLPRRDVPWTALLPGAIGIAVGLQATHLVTVYYLVPKIGQSASLYGALGTAAVLLLWLYILGRLFVAATVLNATLWARREREDQPSSSS